MEDIHASSQWETGKEPPKYQCHKKVWALKIADLSECEQDGSRYIYPEDQSYTPFKVPGKFVAKHKPLIGGYWVVYEDGYASYSPAAAFESGYTKI